MTSEESESGPPEAGRRRLPGASVPKVPGSETAGKAKVKAGAAASTAKGNVGSQVGVMADAAHEDDPRHWRALAALCLAVAATAIDPPVLQATSSGVQGALKVAPEAAAQFIGVIYLVQAGIMVVAGVLGDRLGRKRVMLVGLGGMTIFYALAGLAPTPELWFAAGIVSAFFAAAVIPLALANVMVTFGQRVMPIAFAVYLSAQLMAALSAPALAGFLYDIAGWGATYLPAILFGLAAIYGTITRLPENKAAEAIRWRDQASLALWAIGILLVAYAFVASAGGWGAAHLPALVAGLILIALFLTLAQRSRRARLHTPEAPFRIIAVTLIAAVALGLGQSGVLYQLSGFLKGVQDYSDIASGLAVAPFAIATLVASLAVGAVLERRFRGRGVVDVGWVRSLIVRGLLLAGVSILAFGLIDPATPYLPIGIALAGLGAGASIANVPRTDLLFRAVRPSLRGTAGGLNGGAFLLGEAIGSSFVTVVLATVLGSEWVTRLTAAGVPAVQAEALLQEAQERIFVATLHPYEEPSWLQAVSDIPFFAETYSEAFAMAMVAIGIVVVSAAVVTRLVLRPMTLPATRRGAPAAAAAEPGPSAKG